MPRIPIVFPVADVAFPAIPTPAVLAENPSTPYVPPVAAVALPKTPVPLVLAAYPSTPYVPPVAAVAFPYTPRPLVLAVSPRTPKFTPVVDGTYPYIPYPFVLFDCPRMPNVTPLVAVEVAVSGDPVPFCVTATQMPLVVQVNVDGLVSVIARGVEEGFVTIISRLRSPTVGFANCCVISLRTCSWS
jgi:hypothetical protein